MNPHVWLTFYQRFLLLFLSSAAITVQAAPGDLDPSFAGTGKLRIGFGQGVDVGRAAALQSDGKLLIAGYSGDNGGYFSVVRFHTNQVLDASFGEGGKVVTPVGTDTDYSYARAMGIQLDGKIVLAGNAFNGTNREEFALVRYHTNGTVDTSFGTNGIVFTDFGQDVSGNAIAIQPDGKIIVAGSSFAGGRGDFALARYETNGVLDSTFGGTGMVTTDAGGGASVNSLTLGAGGTIFAVGSGGVNSGHSQFTMVAYTTNGTLEGSFGGGKVFTTIGTGATAYASGIQFGNNTVQNPDKLIVAGESSLKQFTLARYNLNGTLDTNFNGSGIVTTPLGSTDSARSLFTQGAGIQPRKITVGGFTQVGTNYEFALARFTITGALDNTFGSGTGKVLLSFGPGHDDEAYAVFYTSGAIVLAGTTVVTAKNSDFAAARFNSDGSLDTNFGSNGIVTADVLDRSSEARAVVIQPDQKIVLAGDANNGENEVFALARLNADGSFDSSFGSNGKLITVVSDGSANANTVQLQPDGRIVAAGYSGTNRDFAVVRYNSDGTLDGSFGTNGKVTTPLGSAEDEAHALQIQSDGKIVLAGYSSSGSYRDFALVRYTTNGMLDTSFGSNGKVITTVSATADEADALQIQPNGKLVAAGMSAIDTASSDFAVVRYNTNGARDFSFGNLGIITTDIANGSVDQAFAAAIQPDGKIVLGGYVISSGNIFGALTRYTTNGALDNTFGVNGKVITQIGAVSDYITSLALQSDGKIIASGATKVGSNYQLPVLRFNSDGSLDGSFGIGGIVVTNFNDGGDDGGWSVALDPIGRAVVAGSANGRFGVMRFVSDPYLKFLSITLLPNGHVLLQGLGIPNSVHTLSTSSNLSPGSFGPHDFVTPDASGFWQYEDATSVGSKTFYRLSVP